LYFTYRHLFVCSLYNHYENGSLASVLQMKGVQKIAIAFNGGTAENWNDPSKVTHTFLLRNIVAVMCGLMCIQ